MRQDRGLVPLVLLLVMAWSVVGSLVNLVDLGRSAHHQGTEHPFDALLVLLAMGGGVLGLRALGVL